MSVLSGAKIIPVRSCTSSRNSVSVPLGNPRACDSNLMAVESEGDGDTPKIVVTRCDKGIGDRFCKARVYFCQRFKCSDSNLRGFVGSGPLEQGGGRFPGPMPFQGARGKVTHPRLFDEQTPNERGNCFTTLQISQRCCRSCAYSRYFLVQRFPKNISGALVVQIGNVLDGGTADIFILVVAE